MKYLLLLIPLALAACAYIGRDGTINITLDRKIAIETDVETSIKTDVKPKEKLK